jgi:hypothetical protein
MQTDKTASTLCQPQSSFRLLRNILMTGAMEPIATHAVLLIPLIRHGIQKMGLGQGLMKRRVENRHLGNARKRGLTRPDPPQIGRIVQRRKAIAGRNGIQYIHINQHRLLKRLATMNNSMSNALQCRYEPLGIQPVQDGLKR